jgi:alpha-L-fucosidase 2
MKNVFLCLLGIGVGLSFANAQEVFFKKPDRGFTSWQPAENWEQALLSGNGEMGAMVIGQPFDETVILSHSALYLPQKRSGKTFGHSAQLAQIRKLLLSGKYAEAAAIPSDLREKEGFTDQRDPFIPAFDLRIVQQASNVNRYQRAVDFTTGEASVNWQDQSGKYERKVFVSRADSLVVISIKSKEKISCILHFEQRPASWDQMKFIQDGVKEIRSVMDSNLLIFSNEFKNKYPGELTGYAGVGRVIQHGGNQETHDGKLVVTDADEVLILIRIKPAYGALPALVGQLKKEIQAIKPAQKTSDHFSYAALLQSHTAIHGELFNRVKLDLDATAADRNLDSEPLIQRGDREVSPALIERAFDAGRYNILSATGVLPPNLQGLWSGTWTSPWSSGFTTDGNLPTAMSVVLPGNLPELMKGFVDYHEKMLPEYRKEAFNLYGTRGIHIPAQITTRGVETDFGSTWCLTFWTGAAGWTANAFNDYYLYTGDEAFLKAHAYPFMKEAALFYEEFLHTGANGKLLFNPSYSPENNPSGIEAQATINATMDVMIARQLLRNCIAAAQKLHTDVAKITLWRKMLKQMPEYEINEDGAIKEWLWPGLKDNYSHRHSSQLYGLYDGVDPDFVANPALMNAAKVLIGKKMDFRRAEGGGEMAFGLVQLGAAAAHAGDATAAEQLLGWLATKYWTKGMGSYHNVKGLFNTDISGGLPYLVTQMLCASEPGMINILPALPKSWKKGEVNGLLLRGHITLQTLAWNNSKVRLVLKSAINQELKIKIQNRVVSVHLTAGKPSEIKL